MPILTLAGAQLAYGGEPLLDHASCTMDAGERVGLIGRNGTGKSSLLGVIAGRVTLDAGELRASDGLRLALVEQEPALPHAPTLRQSLLLRGHVPAIHDERERWRTEARLGEFLHRFGLDERQSPDTASGGQVKRAALALAFALAPDVLLLDEPTNHLDIDGIERLETALRKQPAAIVVTHDRTFLDGIATRILELDRGALRSYPGTFSDYERVKAAELAAETEALRRTDKLRAQEEAWIRKGIEARRTRNEGRVRRLQRLRAERAARRERLGAVELAIGAGPRSGKLVAELTGVSKRFAERPIVTDLDLRIERGDRIGLIGPNGSGKTTLITLILGTLEPDAGRVRLGANVHPAYFDQLREALDPEQTVAETVAAGSDWVEVDGRRRHVLGYLGDFLFPPGRAQSPVRILSGGERNRLLLARLFARPANVLVLDEPTNDLDIESLELLEAALQEYAGTLLLVSHDRAFLDNVVTQTLAVEAGGVWREYAGGYSDWLLQRPARVADEPPAPKAERPERQPTRVRLTFKEARALDALPGEIETLEAEQHALVARMGAPEYYRHAPDVLRVDQLRHAEIESLLMEKLEQWEALEAKARAADSARQPSRPS